MIPEKLSILVFQKISQYKYSYINVNISSKKLSILILGLENYLYSLNL